MSYEKLIIKESLAENPVKFPPTEVKPKTKDNEQATRNKLP